MGRRGRLSLRSQILLRILSLAGGGRTHSVYARHFSRIKVCRAVKSGLRTNMKYAEVDSDLPRRLFLGTFAGVPILGTLH